MNNRITAPDAN